ncbi:OLC1v1029478C1 [Oldenlandia corymbosa var. corymbosa]|uniref:OLC1v1029478C1 n=1 Tax=Oldenlandia corymbosa var. corymbosa TaxID=529605 RepID=A0AAV1CEN6_OLDCO|nr:OLC1v1029478C1 [Oldenlandia corymbosa var. corymbosa]
MASSAFIPTFKFVHFTYFVLILLPFLLVKGSDASETTDSDFHSVEVSSLLLSQTCNSSTSAAPTGKSTLQIVDRNGACYNGESTKLTLPQILSHDEARVASIQSRHASVSETNGIEDRKTAIPGKPGTSYGTGNYIVTVGLGTPKRYYNLVFDTGSDLTWTQCRPCTRFCYPQNDPIFNPRLSSTYSGISCSSPQCSLLVYGTGNRPGCSGSTCVYGIQYGDKSSSTGFFAKETLSLGRDVLPGFLFGCGQDNRGLFGRTAGLLGLGRSQISLVSQTARKYGRVFSYCLPTWSGANGYLSFGKPVTGFPRTVQFTPFSASRLNTHYYAVDLVGISVGGKLLPISATVFQAAGMIVDSGTVITRLPPAAYSALRNAFRVQMRRYKLAPAFSLLDTCYDFGGLASVAVPKISFIFRGNAVVNLGTGSILVTASQTQVCLAFAGNISPTDPGIFGNVQQQTKEVVFDVAGGRVGFGPGRCS